MPIILAPVANGGIMSAPAVRARLDTIRVYTNAGAIGTDVTGKFQSRHFKRAESYGSPNPRTETASGTNWYDRENGAPMNRAVATYDSFGTDAWRYVWGAVRDIVAPHDDYLVELVVSAWAWHIKSTSLYPEQALSYDEGYPARLVLGVDGDSVDSTERPIWDAGTDPGTDPGNFDDPATNNWSGGPYRYSARNITFCAKARVSKGPHNIGLMCRMQELASEDDVGLLYIGARSVVAEGYRK